MPESLTIGERELHVWYVELALDGDALLAAMHLLSVPERERAGGFRFERDRVPYIAAHAALRAILARYTHAEAAALTFGEEASGKPFLERPRDAVRFNLSHSGELGAVAIVRDAPVGIDIEAIARLPDVELLAESCFSNDERVALASVADAERPYSFLRGWTRKEAYLKAAGGGLRAPLDAFSVSLDTDAPHRVDCASDPRRWLVIPLHPGPAAVAAAVVPEDQWRLREDWWTAGRDPSIPRGS